MVGVSRAEHLKKGSAVKEGSAGTIDPLGGSVF